MAALREMLDDTWQHRSVSAITMVSAGVMLVGIVFVGVGLAVLAVVVLLWAVAPLLGGGFMTWFYEQRPSPYRGGLDAHPRLDRYRCSLATTPPGADRPQRRGRSDRRTVRTRGRDR